MEQLTIQDLFARDKTLWLAECRKEAKRQLQFKPSVTSDDITKNVPRPTYIHRNTTGQIFNNGEFITVGFTISTRKEANGRTIRQWALK